MGLGKNIPMSLIDILTNAAGGGVVGTALHLATDWVDTRNKIALMKAQSLLIEQSEAWKAFGAAQQTASPFCVPDNCPTWASAAYTCVACLKDATRPLLTWGLMGVLVYVYSTATPESRAAITPEITFGAFTALMFWFGSRYTRK
jgi:hypothetical protein